MIYALCFICCLPHSLIVSLLAVSAVECVCGLRRRSGGTRAYLVVIVGPAAFCPKAGGAASLALRP